MIKRDYYLDKIIERMWDGNIKVITGIRRCGKSTMLFTIFKEYLISNNVKEENIIEIALDKRKYYKFRNPIYLCSYVENIINNNKNKRYYLFIDEVQLTIKVKDKESNVEISIYDMLNELKGYSNLDCYVTGSNSKMLSSDIQTEFRGRSSQIRIYPLSFKEIYSYKGGVMNDILDEYIIFGGMPGLINEKNEESKKTYLINLFNEIYIKDLLEHGKIQRQDVIEKLLDYLASSVGSLTNINKLTSIINNQSSIKISDDTISKYINQLCNSFLISEAKRYDIKGKRYFDYPNKYYYLDIGLRNARINYRQLELGHIVENIIYIELLRRGYIVDVGVIEDRRNNTNKQKEIDFIVKNFDKKLYIQSSIKLLDEAKRNSEVDSLRLTKDFFKKVLIRDDILTSFYDEDGIYNCKLTDFLLDKVDLFN